MDQPQLEGYLAHYWQVFTDISKDRAYTEAGPRPISSRNLLDYFELHREFDPVIRDSYTEFILRVDEIWLEVVSKETEAKAPVSTSKKGEAAIPPKRPKKVQ